jgi:hypothetical protein
MKDGVGAIVAIFTAVIGVAIIAVLVSKNSNTTSVLGGLFNGFANVLGKAVAPVTDAGFGGTGNVL